MTSVNSVVQSGFKLKASGIRVVLFDVDATLVHTGGAGVMAFDRVFNSAFGVSGGVERIKFGGRTDFSLVREFFGNHGIEASPENFGRFFAAYLSCLEKLIQESGGGLCPGVPEFYGALAALPDPPQIGLLTGNIRRGAQIKLERHKWWGKFSFGAFGDDHEDRNQIAAIARERGGERLGRMPEGGEVLVIGDTPLDIRCARAIGAKALAVATGSFTVEQLQEHRPDWAVEDLSKITPSEF